MGDLTPVAFDIETSGLDADAVLTVAGLATDAGAWLAVNTTRRTADGDALATRVEERSGLPVTVAVYQTEGKLLSGLRTFAERTLDGDRHYLTAFNGERWRGGFDLPFLRSACVRHNVAWPFPDVPYADVMEMIEYFDTDDITDLVGVYDLLIEGDHCDPFDDSAEAVQAHEAGEWTPLLLHNLADIQRTRKLAVLAEQYVPAKDFGMKQLTPPTP